MMEFKALRMGMLTEEVAANLNRLLDNLPGIECFAIVIEKQEMSILFDERQLGFQALACEMAKVGCPLRNIKAALLVNSSPSE